MQLVFSKFVSGESVLSARTLECLSLPIAWVLFLSLFLEVLITAIPNIIWADGLLELTCEAGSFECCLGE